MKTILQMSRQRRRALQRKVAKIRDGAERLRYLIVIDLALGKGGGQTARELFCFRSTVCRVARRFLEEDEIGLRDHRNQNGALKVGREAERFVSRMVAGIPRQYGWRRPTWTRELLCRTLERELGIRVAATTMGRVLQRLGARRGRPRPVSPCRCSWQERERRLGEIRALLRHLPRDAIYLYQDEVDINLNPKIGWDWMLPGVQKLVVTPGDNVKRYLSGCLDPKRGRLVWVTGERKKSALFIDLMQKLARSYRRYRVIHVILDNHQSHKSKITQTAVADLHGRVVLHFLPPYDPKDNKIERVWEELHANTTRNHTCETIGELMTEVTLTMKALSPYPGSQASLGQVA